MPATPKHRNRRSRTPPCDGFSLLETIVALGIFAIVTLGIVPLLGSALRASSTARSATVAKEAARVVTERIEGTRWYVSYDAKPDKRVDILDLYYPQAASNSSTGQSYAPNAANAPLVGTGGVFTTTCAPAPPSPNPACALDVPAGYTVTIKASFVKKHTPATNPETYDIVTPPGAYSWNSQGNDGAPATLMDVNVTVGWTEQGKSRSYSLRAIVGDRKFTPAAAQDAGPSASPSANGASGPARVQGDASIDYVVQTSTGFSSSSAGTGCSTPPCKSTAQTTFGMSESTINQEDTGATADEVDRVAEFRIVRAYPTTQAPPPTPPADLAAVTKSSSVKHAPPDSYLATDALDPNTTYLTHPELANARQAMIFGGENHYIQTNTSAERPIAYGLFQTYGTTSGIQEGYFTNSQIDFTAMKMDSTQPLGALQRGSGLPLPQLGSWTFANTTALTANPRYVETATRAGFGFLNLFKLVPSSSKSWYMLQLNSADIGVDCKSTANPATAVATANWTMKITYAYDPSNNGTVPNPSFGLITLNGVGNDVLNGVSVANALDALQATNPLEVDGGTAATDIYMFEERDVNGVITKKGYLTDAVANKNPYTSISADGRLTEASVDGAVRIDTAALSATVPETATSISIGKTSCVATDNR